MSTLRVYYEIHANEEPVEVKQQTSVTESSPGKETQVTTSNHAHLV